jgi:SRSO17 transposase
MLISQLDIVLVIDESGDKKRGNNTDYVVKQYLRKFEKIENGIVALTAYAIINEIYYPLIFKVFKPQEALQDQDIYKTKLELKIEIIEELKELGFNIRLILTDTLINEVELISEVLNNLNLKYILALRSNLQDLLETEFTQKLYNLNWETYKCDRYSHPGTVKYINSSIDSQSKSIKYYKFERDYCLEADNTDIYYLKTNSSEEAKNIIIETDWIEYLLEYKFKEAKDKLGWADFRFTNYHSIERWWEIVMSAQLLQTIQSSYYYLDALESARYKLFKSL